MPYALLVANLLYINQFPDRKADAAAGKNNLVVRLPLNFSYLGIPIAGRVGFGLADSNGCGWQAACISPDLCFATVVFLPRLLDFA